LPLRFIPIFYHQEGALKKRRKNQEYQVEWVRYQHKSWRQRYHKTTSLSTIFKDKYMLARLSLWILGLYGWKITGVYPYDTPRLLMAAAPHTSNWDFPLGILVRTAWHIKANFIAKHSLFFWPLSIVMRGLGGIPVDRTVRGNFVTQMIHTALSVPKAHFIIAPEGTRAKTYKFKTGFYHIAKGANMPILPVTFDWGNRVFHFGDLFYPTDDQEADLAMLWEYFRGVEGHTPSKGIS
jgi:1-acyl-sn-glycerol-3-phosphate acyltransferase